MSSNEDKKIIKFPGPKKELKQDVPYQRVLDQEDKQTDNLIESNKVNPFSLDSRLRGNDSSVAKRKPVLININKPADRNVTAKTDRKNRSSLQQKGSSSPGSLVEEKENLIRLENHPDFSGSSIEEKKNLNTLAGQDGGSGKSGKPSYYAVSSVACAVFLMLVGVSYFNSGKFSKDRFLATSNGMLIMPVKIINKDGYEQTVAVYVNEKEELEVDLRRSPKGEEEENIEEMETWKARLNRQEKTILHLITTGQRKLASIGRKPVMKDRFSMEALQSRYDVQWRRGQLSSAKLLEGQEPILFPSMDKVVREYRALFPVYDTFVKEKDSSDQMEVYELLGSLNLSSREIDLADPDQMEVYELRDRENKVVKQVVALKDEQSRLLSVYVVSD
ncbi:MAG: hypothetical protein OXM55_07985 [Bdellovibrionales bacterium]|nr:hypothetical protein [Bdellovibrionales bacterium]